MKTRQTNAELLAEYYADLEAAKREARERYDLEPYGWEDDELEEEAAGEAE